MPHAGDYGGYIREQGRTRGRQGRNEVSVPWLGNGEISRAHQIKSQEPVVFLRLRKSSDDFRSVGESGNRV